TFSFAPIRWRTEPPNKDVGVRRKPHPFSLATAVRPSEIGWPPCRRDARLARDSNSGRECVAISSILSAQLTPSRLMAFSFGFAPPAIIEAGIRLGIFDLLDSGARTADDIATAIGANVRGVRLVLNALVGLDLLTKDPHG